MSSARLGQQGAVVPIELQLAIQADQQVRGVCRIEKFVNLAVGKMAGKLPGKVADQQFVSESRTPIALELTQGAGAEIPAPE